ncbi:MAG: hypothetical protein AAFU58_05080, partial [Pseudomonadota bacterium]
MPLSRLTRTALAVAAALFVIACSGEKNATADTPKDADPETGATEPSALAAETAASAEERAAQEA